MATMTPEELSAFERQVKAGASPLQAVRFLNKLRPSGQEQITEWPATELTQAGGRPSKKVPALEKATANPDGLDIPEFLRRTPTKPPVAPQEATPPPPGPPANFPATEVQYGGLRANGTNPRANAANPRAIAALKQQIEAAQAPVEAPQAPAPAQAPTQPEVPQTPPPAPARPWETPQVTDWASKEKPNVYPKEPPPSIKQVPQWSTPTITPGPTNAGPTGPSVKPSYNPWNSRWLPPQLEELPKPPSVLSRMAPALKTAGGVGSALDIAGDPLGGTLGLLSYAAGPTAAGLVAAMRPDPTAPASEDEFLKNPKAQEAYKKQLEEAGVPPELHKEIEEHHAESVPDEIKQEIEDEKKKKLEQSISEDDMPYGTDASGNSSFLPGMAAAGPSSTQAGLQNPWGALAPPPQISSNANFQGGATPRPRMPAAGGTPPPGSPAPPLPQAKPVGPPPGMYGQPGQPGGYAAPPQQQQQPQQPGQTPPPGQTNGPGVIQQMLGALQGKNGLQGGQHPTGILSGLGMGIGGALNGIGQGIGGLASGIGNGLGSLFNGGQ